MHGYREQISWTSSQLPSAKSIGNVVKAKLLAVLKSPALSSCSLRVETATVRPNGPISSTSSKQ